MTFLDRIFVQKILIRKNLAKQIIYRYNVEYSDMCTVTKLFWSNFSLFCLTVNDYRGLITECNRPIENKKSQMHGAGSTGHIHHSRRLLITAVEAISASSDSSKNDIVNVITPFNSADDVRDVRETQFARHVDWSSQWDLIDPVKGSCGNNHFHKTNNSAGKYRR